ncbi:MAG TPA: hypothetical protein VNK49_03520 [Anaerolineales bacterium]|nr:hypothetical protein [Anaerolineales bacterium]
MSPQKRPLGVTLLLWMVLSLSAWGGIRFAAALQWWDVLIEFESRLSPLYLSITGASWVIAGGVLLFGMMRGTPWVRPALLIYILLWLVVYWIERIFFEAPRANLPFALITSIVLLSLSLMSVLHPKTKRFFTKDEEHEQPDQTSNPE